MYGTIIQQGTFVAVAGTTTLNLQSGVDWVRVYDPVSANAAAAVGFDYRWQSGMAVGTGEILYHAAVSTVVNSGFLVAPAGFTLVDTSVSSLGAPIAVTAGTNVVGPVYSTANTGTIAVGSIVRVVSTAQTDVNGFDFTVGAVNPNVTFTLGNVLSQAPGVVAGANGYWRLVAQNVAQYNRYYPRKRVISNITQAAPGVNVVTTLIDHSYTTGQVIRFKVPAICGMVELNEQLATVTVINAGTFSIDIDTTGYSAFTFPTVAAIPPGTFTPAEVVPVGENSVIAPNVLADATIDNNYRGIILGYDAAGTGLAPAGIAGHTMYWIAGKSVNV